ncbi:MAG: RNA polymerase sigma factor [bacterium]
MATDEELMVLVAKGSLEAFEQIIARYQSSAWKIAYQFLRDSGKAEDMVQEAFLKILDACTTLPAQGSFQDLPVSDIEPPLPSGSPGPTMADD